MLFDGRKGRLRLLLRRSPVVMEVQRRAYGGRLFDVLGDAFRDQPLSKLLMEAIRYGD